MAAHQAQRKWEELYPFAFYSASSRGWFCKICQQYGEGTHWVSEAVHFGEHPKRYLERHRNGNTHKNAVKQKHLFLTMRAKGSIYKQIVSCVGNSNQSIVGRGRRVIKKFMKTVYFFARKQFAIRENFEDVINYLTDLGDIDIQEHLHQSSSRATYVSEASAVEYLTCISDYLNYGLLSRLITTTDFSISADETNDISDSAELATFVKYLDSDFSDVKEEY